MRRQLLMATLAAATLVGAAAEIEAAGGSSSTAPAPTADPRASAVEEYNRALRYRDRAWELEAKAESEPEKADKLLAKAEKEYSKAVRSLRGAVRADPRMFQAYSSLGYALRKLGNYEESLAAYDQALEIEPGYSEAIEYRAEAYLGLDRLEEAKEAYMELFREAPERAAELMAAMESWVEEHRADPGDLSPERVEEFAGWVEERGGLAGKSAALGAGVSIASW